MIIVSMIRMLAGVLPAIGVAWLLYAYDLFTLGPVLVLFFMNLMIMGWSVALGVVSLILRHGAGAEALAWSVLFGLTPFAAVFYPIAASCSRWRSSCRQRTYLRVCARSC
jgi:ABC-2 type transport system permease protein